MKRSERKTVYAVITLVLSLVMVIWCYTHFMEFLQPLQEVQDRAVDTVGIITRIRKDQGKGSASKRGRYTTAWIEYSFGGKEYTLKVICTASDHEGDEVRLKVDPENPGDAWLAEGMTAGIYGAFIPGSIILLFLILLILLVRNAAKRNRKDQPDIDDIIPDIDTYRKNKP